jgi:hypothetical protein
MEALIGKEYGSSRTSAPISLSDVRKWAIAIYYPEVAPRQYWDEEFAATTSQGGIVTPEDFNPFAWFTAEGPNKHQSFEGPVTGSGPEGAFGVEPPATSFIMTGGTELTYGVRMKPGDVITSHPSTVVSYDGRTTRLGETLFTATSSSWTNQRGELVKTIKSTLIRY